MFLHFDLDGVLADMDGKVIEIVGKSFSEFKESEKIGLWRKLEQHPDFFLELNQLPDAEKFVQQAIKLTQQKGWQVGVLTAIPVYGKIPLAAEHKAQWVKKHFPQLHPQFKIGPFAVDKQNHCRPGDILIDDSLRNIQQWKARSGHGILHVSVEESLARLEQLIC